MKSALRLLVLCLVFLAVWSSRASAQAEPETYIVSMYRVAPGQHVAFLQWMANQEAAATEAGVPAGEWYVHQNGDHWDFLQIAPDITDEQNDAIDAAAAARGLKTGPQASIELRQYVAWHTDTFAGGPMTAAALLAAAQGN